MSTIKNVFVSHIHQDDAGLPDLMNLLSKHGIEAKNYSITSDKENNAKSPDYIKKEILAPRIDACSALIVYITPDTKDSSWVNWEIEYAFKHDKRIIGIWELGSNGCDIPNALVEFGDATVGWNNEQIIGAINGSIKGRHNHHSVRIEEQIPITRHPCNK